MTVSKEEFLHEKYFMPEPFEVQSFASVHNNLIPFLFKAYTELRKYFPDEQLSLEVVSDMEDDCNLHPEALWIFISTILSAGEATQRLNEFDENWFLDNMNSVDALVNVNLRFV